MRIISGVYGGHKLCTPRGNVTRPTSDRLRGSIFNILNNLISFEGVRVIDIFAGTGALGLEAFSRGACHITFVEQNPEALRCLRSNVEALRIPKEHTRIFMNNALTLSPCQGAPVELVFMDPPYNQGMIDPVLLRLRHGHWLTKDAIVVCEQSSDERAPKTLGFKIKEERFYGTTCVRFISPTFFDAPQGDERLN